MENLYRKINFDYIINSKAKNFLNKDVIKIVLENYEKTLKTTKDTILSDLDGNNEIKKSYILSNKEVYSIINKDNYKNNNNKLQIITIQNDSKTILTNYEIYTEIEDKNNFIDENTKYLIIENCFDNLRYSCKFSNLMIDKNICSFIFSNRILFYKFRLLNLKNIHFNKLPSSTKYLEIDNINCKNLKITLLALPNKLKSIFLIGEYDLYFIVPFSVENIVISDRKTYDQSRKIKLLKGKIDYLNLRCKEIHRNLIGSSPKYSFENKIHVNTLDISYSKRIFNFDEIKNIYCSCLNTPKHFKFRNLRTRNEIKLIKSGMDNKIQFGNLSPDLEYLILNRGFSNKFTCLPSKLKYLEFYVCNWKNIETMIGNIILPLTLENIVINISNRTIKKDILNIEKGLQKKNNNYFNKKIISKVYYFEKDDINMKSNIYNWSYYEVQI